MTTDLDFVPGTTLALRPGTSFTRLPFGGAVLVCGNTLGVAEYGERDAMILALLLERGVPEPARWAAVRPLVEPLINAGWLVAGPAAAHGGD